MAGPAGSCRPGRTPSGYRLVASPKPRGRRLRTIRTSRRVPGVPLGSPHGTRAPVTSSISWGGQRKVVRGQRTPPGPGFSCAGSGFRFDLGDQIGASGRSPLRGPIPLPINKDYIAARVRPWPLTCSSAPELKRRASQDLRFLWEHLRRIRRSLAF
jgi:hypothetical protein